MSRSSSIERINDTNYQIVSAEIVPCLIGTYFRLEAWDSYSSSLGSNISGYFLDTKNLTLVIDINRGFYSIWPEQSLCSSGWDDAAGDPQASLFAQESKMALSKLPWRFAQFQLHSPHFPARCQQNANRSVWQRKNANVNKIYLIIHSSFQISRSSKMTRSASNQSHENDPSQDSQFSN